MEERSFYLRFGELVKQYRDRHGWKGSELAERAYNGDRSRQSYISSIETGKAGEITEGTISILAKTLGIPNEEIDRLRSSRFNRPSVDIFPFQRIGSIEFPVHRIFGNPESPYRDSDFKFLYTDSEFLKSSAFPTDKRHLIESLVTIWKSTLTEGEQEQLQNNLIARLDGFIPGSEGQLDERGKIILRLSKVRFFEYMATNRRLRAAVPVDGKILTVRDALAPFPLDLEDSLIGNTISSHTVVLSKSKRQSPEEQTVILRRKTGGSIYPGYYSTSGGYVNITHTNASGQPSLFVTAARETLDEIGLGLNITPENVVVNGLCVSWEDLDLNFCCQFQTEFTSEEIMAMPVDHPEGLRLALAWNPRDVLRHVIQEKWEPIGAIATCFSLIGDFGAAEVERESRAAGFKAWYEFLEHRHAYF